MMMKTQIEEFTYHLLCVKKIRLRGLDLTNKKTPQRARGRRGLGSVAAQRSLRRQQVRARCLPRYSTRRIERARPCRHGLIWNRTGGDRTTLLSLRPPHSSVHNLGFRSTSVSYACAGQDLHRSEQHSERPSCLARKCHGVQEGVSALGCHDVQKGTKEADSDRNGGIDLEGGTHTPRPAGLGMALH